VNAVIVIGILVAMLSGWLVASGYWPGAPVHANPPRWRDKAVGDGEVLVSARVFIQHRGRAYRTPFSRMDVRADQLVLRTPGARSVQRVAGVGELLVGTTPEPLVIDAGDISTVVRFGLLGRGLLVEDATQGVVRLAGAGIADAFRRLDLTPATRVYVDRPRVRLWPYWVAMGRRHLADQIRRLHLDPRTDQQL
jgi:hypothetical protein